MANQLYDKDTDYMALIQQDIANKDYASAVVHEAQRNAKIEGEGLDYEQTNTAERNYNRVMGFKQNGGGDASAPGYDRYDAALQKALGMNYDDWRKGAGYQALVQQYGHAGQRAMDDTLGRVAARTGGLASSYATSAAQQQYNEMMMQLEDAAYARYNAERQGLLQGAALEKEREDALYQRYLNDQSQQRYENEWNYNVSRTAQSDARTQVDALIAAKQDVPDWLLAQSGYSREYVNGMKAYYATQGATRGGGSGGYDAGSENNGNKKDWLIVPGYGRLTYEEVKKMLNEGKLSYTEDKDGNFHFRKK